MRTHSLVLAFVVAPALALTGTACAHHASPPVQSALQPRVRQPNSPVRLSAVGKAGACTGTKCGAYRHLVAVLDKAVLHFDYDKAELHPAAAAKLAAVSNAMKAVPDAIVRIEGNCDERGTDEYNLALGQARAQAARDYLIALGIPADHLRSMSYGKEHPIALGHNEAAWARNRRDDMVPLVHE